MDEEAVATIIVMIDERTSFEATEINREGALMAAKTLGIELTKTATLVDTSATLIEEATAIIG